MAYQARDKSLTEFDSAPVTTLFNQNTIAHVRDCSTATLERDRWAGARIPYIQIGSRAVRYRMSDLMSFIESRMRLSTSQ